MTSINKKNKQDKQNKSKETDEDKDDFVTVKVNTTKKKSRKAEKNNLPWSEKYRPTKLEDILLDNLMLKKIRARIKDGVLEDTIITGNTGQGKTTLAVCLTKLIQGDPYNYELGVLKLHASDDKNITTINEVIKPFCKKKFTPIMPKNTDEKKQNKNIYKYIIFDESDNMNEKEQQLIAQIMDKYKSVKFIFTCNHRDKIIPSIQTRCLTVQLQQVDDFKLITHLENIMHKEQIEFTNKAIKKIIKCSEGDIRYAINLLHIVSIGYNKISTKNIKKIICEPPSKVIKNIISLCHEKKSDDAITQLNQLRSSGYSQLDIINILCKECSFYNFKDENDKIQMMKKINYCQICLKKSVNSELQLNSLIFELSQ